MATALRLDPVMQQALEELVASGRFPSPEAAVREGLRRVLADEDGIDISPLTPAELAGVERGLADVAAGRVHDIAEVRAELKRRREARA